MVKNGEDITRITNDELEKFRLNFSSFPKRDVIRHEQSKDIGLNFEFTAFVDCNCSYDGVLFSVVLTIGSGKVEYQELNCQ